MSYASRSELENAVGLLRLTLIVPKDSDDASLVKMALEAASGEIDGALSSLYTTPIVTTGLETDSRSRVDALLKRLNISLAMPHVVSPGSKGIPPIVTQMAEWANGYLQMIQEGTRSLGPVPTVSGSHFGMVDEDTSDVPFISNDMAELWRTVV